MKFHFRLLISALLLTAVTTTAVSMPFTAHALLGVGDETFTYRKLRLPTDPAQIKEFLLDLVARTAIRIVLSATTRQIVGWIQGNGGKNVGFVANLEQELRRQADIAGADFLNFLTGINLCGNISSFLRLSLRTPGLRGRLECSVTDIVQNVQQFYQNFSNGGWPAFIRISLEPQNNPYGAYLIALDAKLDHESQKLISFRDKYSSGKGFIGVEIPVKENCQEFVQSEETLRRAEQAEREIPQEVQEKADIIRKTQQRAEEQGREAPAIGRVRKCFTETKTGTPGEFVANALNEATVGSGLNFGATAKYFDEAITAIVNALINKAISSSAGIFAGGGGSSSSSAGAGSFSDSTFSQLRPSAVSGGSLEAQVGSSILTTDALTATTDAKLIQTRRAIFAARVNGTGASAQLLSDLGAAFDEKNRLASLKQGFLDAHNTLTGTATDEKTLEAIQRVPTLLSELQRDLLPLREQPIIALPFSDPRRDTLELLSKTRTGLNNEVTLLNDTISEMNRTATTTPVGTTTLAYLLTFPSVENAVKELTHRATYSTVTFTKEKLIEFYTIYAKARAQLLALQQLLGRTAEIQSDLSSATTKEAIERVVESASKEMTNAIIQIRKTDALLQEIDVVLNVIVPPPPPRELYESGGGE